MAKDGPKPHPARQPQRREVIHLAGSASVVVFAAGYLLADFQPDRLHGIVRSVAAVATVALLLWLHEIRVVRKLERIEARIEARLARAEYWSLYSDVMADLGGGDAPTSGAPRR